MRRDAAEGFSISEGKNCPDNLILSVFRGAEFPLLSFNVKPFRAFWKNNSTDPAIPLLKGSGWGRTFGLSADLIPSVFVIEAIHEKMALAPPHAGPIIGRISLKLDSLFSYEERQPFPGCQLAAAVCSAEPRLTV